MADTEQQRRRQADESVMTWPAQPVIYEVNTAVWLDALSRTAGRPVRFADVSDADWDAIAPAGADAVWLMGVWERSAAGLTVAKANSALMASFRDALPDLEDDDIIGSPYCIRSYVADARFGGRDGLAAARSALAARGMRLVLDYVPNHVAPDHAWVDQHPERFITGQAADITDHPDAWMQVGSSVLAHGRDPYFPPWPDVVQLNAFSPELRAATADTLADIAAQCDGIRCDMAMLMTNNVFAKTWGAWSGPEPPEEFWPLVIASLRSEHPDTVLIAEAYWDLEWELQQQGFDFCYDKRLYDRLLGGDVEGLRGHLRADVGYQSRLLRFLENHDEPRVASRTAPEVARAAAVVIATLPGATLWHEGQFEGRTVRPPVFLSRRPDEIADVEGAAWYAGLLSSVANSEMRDGSWQLLEVTGWPDNQTCRDLLAWAWTHERSERRQVVVVNLSPAAAQGRVRIPGLDPHDRTCRVTDILQRVRFDRSGDELAGPGLFVALPPWEFHVLEVD
ncbi:MAG: alpha-amylase family glycosyl hydrolase [Actinomycetes bacterium]